MISLCALCPAVANSPYTFENWYSQWPILSDFVENTLQLERASTVVDEIINGQDLSVGR